MWRFLKSLWRRYLCATPPFPEVYDQGRIDMYLSPFLWSLERTCAAIRKRAKGKKTQEARLDRDWQEFNQGNDEAYQGYLEQFDPNDPSAPVFLLFYVDVDD